MDDSAAGSTAVPSGWYPDPQVAGTMRYWDGAAWTEHAATGYDPAPVAAEVFSPYQRTVSSRPVERFSDVNQQSLVAIGFAVAYLVIAQFAGVVLLGIVPILAGVRAIQRGEPLAPLAMVFAVVAGVVGLMAIAG